MTLIRGIPPRWDKPFKDGLDVEALNAHIRAWQEVVGPAGWEINFAPVDPDGDDKRASIDLDAIHRRGAMRIRADAPVSQVDRLIVHELLHAVMAGMEDTFNRSLTEHGSEVQAFLRGEWTRHQEPVIERLTSLITGTVVEQWHDDPVWTAAFPVSE